VEQGPRPHGRRARERSGSIASSWWTTLCWRIITIGRRPSRPKGPIQLQTHGGEIRWRNIFIREIGSEEANKILASHGRRGLQVHLSMAAISPAGRGRRITTSRRGRHPVAVHKKAGQYTPPANTPISWPACRSSCRPGATTALHPLPREGDNRLPRHVRTPSCSTTTTRRPRATKLTRARRTAQPYGMVAAARGYQHPIGEWNFEEVTIQGSKIKVELNGTMILDCDLSTVTEYMGRPRASRQRPHQRVFLASPATTTQSPSATSRSSRSKLIPRLH